MSYPEGFPARDSFEAWNECEAKHLAEYDTAQALRQIKPELVSNLALIALDLEQSDNKSPAISKQYSYL
jgi:hypothetical protein